MSLPLPEGYEPHEFPADYSGAFWLEGQMQAYGQACREAALLEAHLQCLYVSDATSEGHSALASPSSAAEDCADRIMAIRNLK